ncbi:hypothetical protein Q4602_12610 [Paraglaciecola chathamensis]|uniref:hypothetical protein n=1 Tax=Paraglaciecola chathamensis TaxID=368405 RepID=UPI0027102E4B|nr:hypothetical protein [Paraglaciecola chathamensis]MDO6840318.1 hypothetical protein [Paraglaciecola chathamensis]
MFTLSAFFFVLTWPITRHFSFIYEFFNFIFVNMDEADFRLYIIILNSLFVSYLLAYLLNILKMRAYWKFINREYLLREKTKSKQGDGISLPSDVSSIEGGRDIPVPRSITNLSFMVTHHLNAQDNGQLVTAFKSIALDHPTAVLICLSDRKCYIGFISQITIKKDGTTPDGVTFFPFFSGYRNKDNMCLEITTCYQQSLKLFSSTKESISKMSVSEQGKLVDTVSRYRISVSYCDMVSIAHFDFSQYEDFKNQEEEILENGIFGNKKNDDNNNVIDNQ